MSPDQFLSTLQKSGPAPVYLFLGPEAYQRERCRRELIRAALGDDPEARESGFARHDLGDSSLASALDDARAMSLFASRRLIWIAAAEAALPRTRVSSTADEEAGEADRDAASLAAYLREPTPGTVVVIEASRYEFDGEDKAKLERVQKFYAAIPAQVEFRPYSPESARALGQTLAKEAGFSSAWPNWRFCWRPREAKRRASPNEIEKLRLFAGTRKVTADDIAALVARCAATTIFALVAALGRGDRDPRARNPGHAGRVKASTCRSR